MSRTDRLITATMSDSPNKDTLSQVAEENRQAPTVTAKSIVVRDERRYAFTWQPLLSR